MCFVGIVLAGTHGEPDMIELLADDCLEVMKGIPDKSVDMVLCDLSYGVSEANWDCLIPMDQLWLQYERITKVNGAGRHCF
jgi:DNA modification methylase